MKRKLTVALAAAAIAAVPMSGAMASSHETAEVVIVHGVPDLEVDILVDGEAAEGLTGLNFEDVARVDLPAGTVDLGVAAAGTTDAILEAPGTELTAGGSYSVVAHLTEAGEPTLSLDANVTDEGAGIQVFHKAAFGAVDILPTEATGLEGVTNPATAFVPTGAGDVEGVGVAAAGSDEAAIDLGTVTVPEDTSVLAYAIGDADTLTVVTQTIAVDAAEMEQPDSVDAGTAGLADSGLPTMVVGLMALGALGLVVPAAATARRRS